MIEGRKAESESKLGPFGEEKGKFKGQRFRVKWVKSQTNLLISSRSPYYSSSTTSTFSTTPGNPLRVPVVKSYDGCDFRRLVFGSF